MNDLTPRVPPHNLDAEISVLGSVLIDNDQLSNPVVSQLDGGDFYRDGHRKIWNCLAKLRGVIGSNGQPGPVDLTTLGEELLRRGQLDEVGGLSYLIGLGEQTPTAAYAEHYARIVLEKAHLRRLISFGGRLMAAAYTGEQPLEDIDALASQAPQFELAREGLVSITDDLESVLQQAQDGSGPQGAPTGLADLDREIGGLEAGRLYVLAARPGFGKTALAFQMAAHVASTWGRVLGFSLEMPTEEISARLVCSDARVDLARFSEARRGKSDVLSVHDWDRLGDARKRLAGARLDMLARPGLKLQELLDTVRREHARDPLALFVLDYVQLVQVSGKAGENAVQRVTLISNALKALAMELGIPVLALAQLSRAVEQRPNHRPLLSDLRESGSLEQDADVVVFIYREEMYDKSTDQQGVAEIIIGKQRNGPTGTVKVQYLSRFTRFTNLAYSSYSGSAV